jgi:hypothetical protein
VKKEHNMRIEKWTAGVALALVAFGGQAVAATVQIDAGKLPATGKVDERFQSYNIEMAQIIGAQFWKPYSNMSKTSDAPKAPPNVGGRDPNLFEARPPVDLSNPRLRALAAALGPAYMRVSGTWANTVHFQNNDDPQPPVPPAGFRGVLTRAQWKGVVDFAKAADAAIVTSFAMNVPVRDASGTWTPVEAQQLIAYTHAIGGQIYAAELFNEPNLPAYGGAPKGYDAQSFARDEAAFRAFVKNAAPEMKIAGPGSAGMGNMTMPGGLTAEGMISVEPRAQFDIVSYHYYGAVSQRCAPPGSPISGSPDKALNETWLLGTDRALASLKPLRDKYAPNAPIWLTETAGAACGGTPWDATFLDTFRYLDQMGRLAKQGVSAIFHNTLSASEYGLIDETTLTPRPNYWAALLWHRLMGTTVLDAGANRSDLHVYAHCLRDYPGGVGVLAINLDKGAATVDLPGPADVYALTAAKLQSGTAMLNGKVLALQAGDKLPPLQPKHVTGKHVTLAPTSIAFIAMPGAKNSACN